MLQATHAAKQQQDNLDELRRRAELESLRPFVKESCCFLPSANPNTAVIGMDELKKLARSWKLHERRNFWKNYPDITSLCTVLLQFVEDTHKVVREPKTEMTPTPPMESKSSRRISNKSTSSKMRQIYGLNYFNREVTEKELALHSRFFTFPADGDDNAKALEIEQHAEDHAAVWTSARKDRIKTEIKMVNLLRGGVTKESMEAKRAKHLNLAQHLVSFSSSDKCLDERGMPVTAIQTFVSVSDTTDPLTASCALIALSNIASMRHVRAFMMENSLIHRVANIVPVAKGPAAALAVGRFFYYFSIDPEIEDRIYGAGGSLIAANGLTANKELQKLSLKTLANLMPCGDRLRVTEIVMRIIHTFVSTDCDDPSEYDVDTFDREISLTYLPLLLSISSFSNTHGALLASDVLDLLVKISLYAKAKNDFEIAIMASRILLSFLEQQDHHVTHEIAHEDNFIFAFEKLLEIRNETVLENCVHAICIMSGTTDMIDCVSDSEIAGVISHTIFAWETLPSIVAHDAATYYSNVCQHKNKEYLRRLVLDDKIALSLMALIGKAGDNIGAQRIAIRALQNLLTVSESCIELCTSVLPTLTHMMQVHHDLGAAQSIYNLSCSQECISVLKEHGVHVHTLEYYMNTENLEVRQTYLEIICQMFSDAKVIDEMLAAGIVEIVSETVTGQETSNMWPIVTKIVLNIVDHCKVMTEKQRIQIVGLLRVICVDGTDDDIIGKASVVLAYLSLTLEDFSEVDSVLRSILRLSKHDLVIESVSIILYNVTCSQKNADILLKDSVYIQIMINIMRNGRPETQINIAKAMRTLCSMEECINLLMKGPNLADLIVIALLRSSSVEIKEVCSHAFYNMLTHYDPREKLLKGDLWWAITRICRNDSSDIHFSAAKALLDLSIDAENSDSLREHHIFSFIQELSVGSDINFVDICMKSTQNLCDQFEGSFQAYEFICLIKIATDAVARCTNIVTVRSALTILVNVSVQRVSGWDQSFIEDVELQDALLSSKDVWGSDGDCRNSVAALLWNISSSKLILKNAVNKFVLADLNPIMDVCYSVAPSASTNEFLLGTLDHYVTLPDRGDGATEENVIAINVCYELIFDAYGVGKNEMAITNSGKVFAMTILAYIASTMDLSQVSSTKVLGLVTHENMHNHDLKHNLYLVMHEFSKYESTANFLLDAEIFTLLLKSTQAMTTVNQKALEYCTCTIRNISHHKNLVPRVVRTMDLDELVRYIIDASQTEEISYDISLMMFSAQEYMLKNDFVINSEFCLEISSKIMEVWKGKERNAKICKYVIGEVLEKYSEGIFVDPGFVQSMFQEMTSGNFKEVKDHCHQQKCRGVEMKCHFNLPPIEAKPAVELKYFLTASAADQWKPFLVTERKRMVTEMLDRSIIVPTFYTKLIVTHKRGHDGWNKIEEEHKRMQLMHPNEVQEYFSNVLEEGEEGEEDEEKEGGEGGVTGKMAHLKMAGEGEAEEKQHEEKHAAS